MFVNTILITLIYLITIFSGTPDNSYKQLISTANSIPYNYNLKHGQWSIYVLNTKNNEVILDINSTKSLAPASNLKIITSAAAFALLGEEKQFNTYLEYSGKINDKGILDGNLYIRGEGDPTLGSAYMEGVLELDLLIDQWVNAIKAKSVLQIEGDIIADDSYLDYMPVPGGWYWTDMGNYYAAGTSGLCINENLYQLYFKPSKTVGYKATILRTVPKVPDLVFLNHMKTGPAGSGDNGYIYAAPWQYLHQLEGTIPAGVKEFSIKGALPDPAKFSAQCLYTSLIKNGITIKGKPLSIREYSGSNRSQKILFSTVSPPLEDIIYRLNKRSVNLYAEQLLKIIGKAIKGEGTLENGIDVVEDWLEKKKIYTTGFFLHDGSGLSRENATTTRLFAELLSAISREPFFEAFFNSLGIAGDPNDIGYMKNMCKNTRAAKNLRAKTGEINRVRAHSGYVYTRSGTLLSFSMIANNYSGSRRTIDGLHEKVMIQLAELP